jgi:diphthamide synthase (EF-2-diphthine--ammonia ligase)
VKKALLSCSSGKDCAWSERVGLPLWAVDLPWPCSNAEYERLMGGVRAKITCVDPRELGASYAGREFDLEFFGSLPAGIDPRGQNGEFHSLVYDAPGFSRAIAVQGGEVVERDGFVSRM